MYKDLLIIEFQVDLSKIIGVATTVATISIKIINYDAERLRSILFNEVQRIILIF